jgi:hypothetical protein
MDSEFDRVGIEQAQTGGLELFLFGCELALFLPRHVRQELVIACDADLLDEAIMEVVEPPVDGFSMLFRFDLHLFGRTRAISGSQPWAIHTAGFYRESAALPCYGRTLHSEGSLRPGKSYRAAGRQTTSGGRYS